MADEKISALTLADAVDFAADLTVIVDVSDSTQSPGGTTKHVTINQLQPTVFDASAVTTGTLAAARLPTTGLEIDAYTTSWGVATDGATVTFDLAAHSKWKVTLGGDRTLALANPGTASSFTVQLIQDGTGSRTVTWWSGILWSGGTAPTLTTSPTKRDVFTFLTDGSGVYLGFTAGQNY